MNKLRVLKISHMYPREWKPEAGIFVHKLTLSLLRAGAKVNVVAPIPWVPQLLQSAKTEWREYRDAKQRVEVDGIDVWIPRYIDFPRGAFMSSSGIRMYHGSRRALNQAIAELKPNLIHSHVALPDGQAGLLLCKELNLPLVVTVHGQDINATIHRSGRARHAVGTVLRGANRIIFVSQMLRDVALKVFPDIPSSRYTVISNGIDIHSIQPEEVLSLSERSQGKRILTVARLTQTKGIDTLLHAFAILLPERPNLELKVIGEGPCQHSLQGLAKTLGVSTHVQFTGALPHDAVMKKMAQCDIFCLPSWREGFGIVYLEAGLFGKPVIACRDQGISDVITDHLNGLLVQPKSTEALVHALKHLLDNKDMAQSYGAALKNLVRSQYSWDTVAQKTLTEYRHILERSEAIR